MHCTGCEDTIERAVAALPGVDKVRADYVKQMVAVEFDRRSPLVIGLLNGLMLGCGPLQAMLLLAAGTGSAQEGATMLFFFGLGTLVPLLSFGLVASSVSRDIINLLVRASAILVISMGLMMADRGLKLTGSGSDFTSLSSRWQQITPADNYLESNDAIRQR